MSNEAVEQNTQAPVEQEAPVVEKSEPSNDKSVGGLKYYKELLDRERAEREKVTQELESIKVSKLKEQNQWKDLYEIEQKKSKEATEKFERVRDAVISDKRRVAVEREASKLGILETAMEDLDMIDMSMIQMETTSNGNVIFHNVKECIEAVKLKKPHWFANSAPPSINNKRPGSYEKVEMTAEDILALEKTDKAEYYRVMQARLKAR